MLKNPKTIMGVLLIALLFWWSTHNAEKQQEAMRKQMKQGQTQEQREQDSLKAIKGEKVLGTPELVSGSNPANPSGPNPSSTLGAPNTAASQTPSELAAVKPVVEIPDSGTLQDPMAGTVHRKITVVSEYFSVTLDSRGAMVRSIIPQVLANSQGEFPELIEDQEAGALTIAFDKTDFAEVLFAVDANTPDTIRIENPTEISFRWADAMGRSVVRVYRFTPGQNFFGHVTRIHGFMSKLYTLNWKGGMRETEHFPKEASSFGMGGYFFSEVVLNNSFNVLRETPTEMTWFNKDQGKSLWVGLRRKYIAGVINWRGESEASIGADPFGKKDNNPGTYKLVVSDLMKSDSVAFDFVVLPLLHSKIEAMGQSYEKIMFSGWEWLGADKWFVALCGGILRLLNIFYSLLPNYGIAIILLTLVMKFITMPLTVKQLRSTREMQRHKPEIDAIRLRNRANPQKLQQELMAYYSKNGVNPFSAMFGCFTMILQMPVFIGLFVVLGRAVELRGAPFIGWIQDLSAPDVIVEAFRIPFLMPQGLVILPFIMAFTTWFQTKQTITDPNQKAMVWMMPIMMLLFSSVMPSGLIVYWIVSNLFSIVQYWFINRSK